MNKFIRKLFSVKLGLITAIMTFIPLQNVYSDSLNKSFEDEKLIMNFNAVIDAIDKEKSNNAIKGDLIKQAFLTSTMGVSYKIKLGKSI